MHKQQQEFHPFFLFFNPNQLGTEAFWGSAFTGQSMHHCYSTRPH